LRADLAEAPTWLELGNSVNQRPTYKQNNVWKSTWACWLLSVLEGLHTQHYTNKLFTSGTIDASSVADSWKVTWATPNGNGKKTAGTFTIYDETYRGTWQQTVEEIWGLNIFGVGGKDFQQRIGDAPKGGGPGRATVIEKYFQAIDKNIKVEGEMVGIHGSTTRKQLDNLFKPSKTGPGVATVWTIDKNNNHAISVHSVTQKASGYELEVFNQAKDEYEGDPVGWYKVEPKKDGCHSVNNENNKCKEVFKYTITGLPH